MTIALIGGGIMGEAIVSNLLARGVVTAGDIKVSDISPERRGLMERSYGVTVLADSKQAARGADTVILAIKPQDLPVAMTYLKGLAPRQLVLSIIAGAKLDTLTQGLGHLAVARAMPNMPARIGRGITVWTATPEVSDQQKDGVRSLLQALGKEIYVADEKYIDMATALSGSGPAYVFVVIEALIDAGVHLGLSREIARELTLETIAGSVETVRALNKHPAELKDMVASPGGTTVEGLLELERGALRSVLCQAVLAAYHKAARLAGNSK